MPKLQTLTLLVLFTAPALAETVLWKASGTLTTGTGVFQRQDLSPNDSVTIRMTYEDDAVQKITSGPFLGRTDSDYWQNIDLRISISTGTYTWEGSVETAIEGSPYTFFTRDKGTSGTAESLDIKISSADQGVFSSFPFRLGDSTASFFLDLRSSNSALLDGGISPSDIHPSELANATGTISTGTGNDLTFTIDPASLEILFEADEAIAPIAPVPSIFLTAQNVSISWQSDFRFRYRIESSPDLSSSNWTELETRFGTDAPISRSYPLSTQTLFYRIVALDRPPLD